MTTLDESVLAFIGIDGRIPPAVAERFPGFDVTRLMRAQLVDLVVVEPDTVGHVADLVLGEMRFVLTRRGQMSIGLDATD